MHPLWRKVLQTVVVLFAFDREGVPRCMRLFGNSAVQATTFLAVTTTEGQVNPE